MLLIDLWPQMLLLDSPLFQAFELKSTFATRDYLHPPQTYCFVQGPSRWLEETLKFGTTQATDACQASEQLYSLLNIARGIRNLLGALGIAVSNSWL